jgi:hypothetical protein
MLVLFIGGDYREIDSGEKKRTPSTQRGNEGLRDRGTKWN